MTTVLREIHTSDISCLSRVYPAFNLLRYPAIRHVFNEEGMSFEFNLDKRDSEQGLLSGRKKKLIVVSFMGKTGYGKSTTLNKIIGTDVFASDAISSCTKECQASIFQFTDRIGGLALIDFPGMGESENVDQVYFKIYQEFLEKTHLVVYFLRADQRDYAVDERVFNELLRDFRAKQRVLIGINFADKIEPMHSDIPFKPSSTQMANLQNKVRKVSEIFGVSKSKTLFFSADTQYNLKHFVNAIARNLSVARASDVSEMKKPISILKV